jgi:hypothetical protein
MEACQPQNVIVKSRSEYIVCLQRKNNPRISVRICEQSCKLKDQCKEYQSFFGLLSKGQGAVFSREAQIA